MMLAVEEGNRVEEITVRGQEYRALLLGEGENEVIGQSFLSAAAKV